MTSLNSCWQFKGERAELSALEMNICFLGGCTKLIHSKLPLPVNSTTQVSNKNDGALWKSRWALISSLEHTKFNFHLALPSMFSHFSDWAFNSAMISHKSCKARVAWHTLDCSPFVKGTLCVYLLNRHQLFHTKLVKDNKKDKNKHCTLILTYKYGLSQMLISDAPQ